MKDILLCILGFGLIFQSCLLSNNNTEEISFEVKTTDPYDLEIFVDGIIPWISIENPNAELNRLIGKDEVVLKGTSAIIIIDYPVANPIEIQIKPAKIEGFTRGELISIISKEYHRIYKEEEESAVTKTTPLEEREGLINRNQTDGKYGIWGHDIGDLDLTAIIIRPQPNGIPKLELIVES